jgi:hypothetical protein
VERATTTDTGQDDLPGVGRSRASHATCLPDEADGPSHLGLEGLRTLGLGAHQPVSTEEFGDGPLAIWSFPVSTYQTDPRVDDFIDSLPDWQQDICLQVRKLVHAADPDVIETIKRTRLPYFTLDGNICALLAAKDHVNVFIYDPIAPDPEGLINQGHDNLTARAIQVRHGDVINERALVNLFKAVIANNRAGGWRKVGRSSDSIT